MFIIKIEGKKMNDYNFLKRVYGEKFAQLCREYFPIIQEKEGLLSQLILSSFAPSKALYDDLIKFNQTAEFKDLIYDKYMQSIDYDSPEYADSTKTVEELLSDAGYLLYPECKTTKELLSFKKYYTPDELLCSFDSFNKRLEGSRVWFIVKKNVEDYKREDYTKPDREDGYSTSVLSIQVTKSENPRLSIISRYNHSVSYPNSTYHNNLDMIAKGLTKAFCREFGFNITNTKYPVHFHLPHYHLANDGRYYKSIKELAPTTFLCENNYVIAENEIFRFDPDMYVLMGTGDLIDAENKTIREPLLPVPEGEKKEIVEKYNKLVTKTPFAKSFDKIKKIDFEGKPGKSKKVIIYPEDSDNRPGEVIIELDKSNNLVGITDSMIESPDSYLTDNTTIKHASFPNLKKINSNFLSRAYFLEQLDIEKVEEIANFCLRYPENLESIYAPNLIRIGDRNFEKLVKVKEFYAPKLKKIGKNSINGNIDSFIANELTEIGECSVKCSFKHLEVDSLETLFQMEPRTIEYISAKNAKKFNVIYENAWKFRAKELMYAEIGNPETQAFFDQVINRNLQEKAKIDEEEVSQKR